MQEPISKHNPGLRLLVNAAISLAILDGGFIIGIQIIDFLLNYFGAGFANQHDALEKIGKVHFLISIISILNLSVIIFRVTSLARGVKYSGFLCYQYAMRRWPSLILLYIVGSLILLSISIIAVKILNMFVTTSLAEYNKIIMFIILFLIPYGLFACIFVVDQAKNPLQAISATFKMLKQRVSFNLLFSVSLLYAVPYCVNNILGHMINATYLSLFATIWILFCHILTIIIYVSVNEFPTIKTDEKNAKVIIA